ncbi:hypothetical protein DEJ50_32025 [Streptomyces venezuelae]|uniref:HEAT repeat domain-containing protein n=1 Tax=Streptomyces venezuelae TaxID=54571 RepID=A0A5P2D9G1_STRVZ|nr:hypothetical protein [Streptomyces venezuelae]QES51794.1 hypothetical protein DEJ50_32025 [Streptomyces venezuelae]
MITTVEQLLSALDSLPHKARLRYTAVTAHRLAARGELRPLLTALDRLGPYERRLAALAALAGGDSSHLAARLADPDPVVRRYALRGARSSAVPDRAIEAAHDNAPATVRADLARLLRDGSRPALAERLLLRLRTERGDRDAALLLPGCSPEFTSRMLPGLSGAVAFEGWSLLARRHPAVVLDQVERELAALTPGQRNGWWPHRANGIAAALPADPARVLDLLERYGPADLPGPLHDRLADLVDAGPERVARWLADPGRHSARWERTPSPAVLRRLVEAAPPSLHRLAARWSHRGAFPTMVRAVPPAGRAAFLDAVATAARHPVPPDAVLALLPPADRYARVRAYVAQGRTERWAAYDLWPTLALLPPAEARPELLAAAGSGDADDRALAWRALVENAGYTAAPAELAAVLDLAARRLGNERDPVRRSALEALTALPAPLFAAALGGAPAGPAGRKARDDLQLLCRNALRARDCSPATRTAVHTLAVALLNTSANDELFCLSVQLMEALTAHTGSVALTRLDRALRPGRERALLEAVRPWLDTAAGRGDHAPLLALVEAFGTRAHRIPELQERLADALRNCSDGAFAGLAAAWLADPATRAERVAVLIEQDPSAAGTGPVLDVLAADRTDLLDHALADPPPTGRFPAPGTPRTLPRFRHADRWLPRQQRNAVRLAEAALADPGRPLDERAALLREVAAVPGYGYELVRRYADAEEAGADTTALVNAAAAEDPDAALRLLLDRAGTADAAAAWAGADRVALHARPDALAGLLQEVLTRKSGVKVTAAKSAARLAARHLPPADAAPLLAGAALGTAAHPDLRAAAVAMAPALLPAEEAWALLESAVAEGPESARRAVLRSPAEVDQAHRSRYGRLIVGLLATADESTSQFVFWTLSDWSAHTPAVTETLAEIVTDLASPLAWQSAAEVLLGIAASAGPEEPGRANAAAAVGLLHAAVARLLAALATDAPADSDRDGLDLPARHRLESMFGDSGGTVHRGLCAPLARQLAGDPRLTGLRTSLLVRAVDPAAPEPELTAACRELVAAVADRPVLAGRCAEQLYRRHRHASRTVQDPEVPLAAVRALSAAGQAAGLFAAALAAALGPGLGWPKPWTDAVHSLRHHQDTEVREAAYAIDLTAE